MKNFILLFMGLVLMFAVAPNVAMSQGSRPSIDGDLDTTRPSQPTDDVGDHNDDYDYPPNSGDSRPSIDNAGGYAFVEFNAIPQTATDQRRTYEPLMLEVTNAVATNSNEQPIDINELTNSELFYKEMQTAMLLPPDSTASAPSDGQDSSTIVVVDSDGDRMIIIGQ